MNELTLDGKTYVSSKRAAEITGYAKDYVGQLCREGRIEARLVGRNWYVLKEAVEKHRFGSVASEPTAAEEVPSNFEPDAWEEPKYSTEEPSIPALEATQTAWQEWLTNHDIEKENKFDEEEPLAPEPEIFDKNPLSLQEEEDTQGEGSAPQTLNLRRIREYDVELDSEETLEYLQKEEKRISHSFISYLLIACAILALFVGYIAVGVSPKSVISFRPLNLIAGVSAYNKPAK